MKILFLGVGNMGGAILKGMANSGSFTSENLGFYEVNNNLAHDILSDAKVNRSKDLVSGLDWADIIMVCVKPQAFKALAEEITAKLLSKKIFVSIMAGVTTSAMQRAIDPNLARNHTYVRTMPNLPLSIGKGAIAIADDNVESEVVEKISEIFETVGQVSLVKENQMDAVTGLSGSGPAYVFEFIEAMIQGGVKSGLTREVATELTLATVKGSVELIEATGKVPPELTAMVSSPAGTTVYGLHELSKGNLKFTVMNAIESATNRSEELGKIQL